MKRYLKPFKPRSLNWIWLAPLVVVVVWGLSLLSLISFQHFDSSLAFDDFMSWAFGITDFS